MSREKKGYLDSHELLRRSAKGLWTKGNIEGDSIVISCHRKHEVRGDVVYEIDPDGDIIRSGHARSFDWGDPWGVVGEIKLTDELAGMCNPVKFGDFSVAMMRHAVCLISAGYGDSLKDVIKWFDEDGMGYMVDVDFLFIGDSGKFEGLIGQRAHVALCDDKDTDKGILAAIEVGQSKFNVELASDEDLVDFVIATSPV